MLFQLNFLILLLDLVMIMLYDLLIQRPIIQTYTHREQTDVIVSEEIWVGTIAYKVH